MLQNELLDVQKLAELAENEPLQIAGFPEISQKNSAHPHRFNRTGFMVITMQALHGILLLMLVHRAGRVAVPVRESVGFHHRRKNTDGDERSDHFRRCSTPGHPRSPSTIA